MRDANAPTTFPINTNFAKTGPCRVNPRWPVVLLIGLLCGLAYGRAIGRNSPAHIELFVQRYNATPHRFNGLPPPTRSCRRSSGSRSVFRDGTLARTCSDADSYTTWQVVGRAGGFGLELCCDAIEPNVLLARPRRDHRAARDHSSPPLLWRDSPRRAWQDRFASRCRPARLYPGRGPGFWNDLQARLGVARRVAPSLWRRSNRQQRGWER
jgi:hypothetical protein